MYILDDDSYYIWLIDIIDPSGINREIFSRMLNILRFTLYSWRILNDDNRVSDGIDLRNKYKKEIGYFSDVVETSQECSILELLVALSIRIEDDIMGEPGNDHPEKWFWEMIHNLGLDIHDDVHFNERKCREILDVLIERTYEKNGTGGLFPLKKTRKDQRKVEIWYQMNEYLYEKYPVSYI